MQIYNASISDSVTTSAQLNAAYIGHPEVMEKVVREICNEYDYHFTAMALGYGRYITEAEIQSTKGKLTIGNNNVSWAIRPRLRQLVTLAAAINSGVGGSGAAFTMTVGAGDNWLRAGMTVKYNYGGTGSYIQFYVISGPAQNGGNWDYQVKIESSASTTVPTTIPSGAKLGYTTIAQASCSTAITIMPKQFYDIYRNYNTTMKAKRVICKDGVATVTWFVGENGEKCWAPVEEKEFDQEFLKDLEFGLVYNVSTVAANGTVYLTDANGDQVMKGDGLLAQIVSGNKVTWDISTFYQQPANYQTFLDLFKEAVENWGIAYGIKGNMPLFVHTGRKGFGFLQDVWKDYADQSGGCCFVFNYREGKDEEMKLSSSIMRYKFSSFEIILVHAGIFDDIGVQGTAQTGVATNAPPLESYRMLVMPDSDCDGNPLLQLLFRGGCGLDEIFSSSYSPGTIDPWNATKKPKISTSDYSGYEIKKEVEYNLVVRDPSKILDFVPYQS